MMISGAEHVSGDAQQAHRILVVDDNAAIHEDFRRLLRGSQHENAELASLMMSFDTAAPSSVQQAIGTYELDSTFQGRDALEAVESALATGRPYSLAFVDICMPPGWDGIETIGHIWSSDPHIITVLCTAYTDYTWSDIIEHLGICERLLFLRKPFDPDTVKQIALAMTRRWVVDQTLRASICSLEHALAERAYERGAAYRDSEDRRARALVFCPQCGFVL